MFAAKFCAFCRRPQNRHVTCDVRLKSKLTGRFAMNVYICWHRGTMGYGCRLRGKKWLFVPELGQPDNNIYKNISLEDLVFKNPVEKRLEILHEQDVDENKNKFSKILRFLVFPQYKAHTVCGLLLHKFH